MDDVEAAPTAGIVACLLVLLLLAVPYLLVGGSGDVTTYYNAGAITPLAAGLFALIGVIVFAAGREERSDPALVAGAGLVLGLFIFVISLAWALTVPGRIVVQIGEVRTGALLFQYHRYLLALAALGVPLAGGWYAKALRLL